MSYLSLSNIFTKNHNPFLSLPETTKTTERKSLILNDNQLIKMTTTINNNNNNKDRTNEIIQQVWSKHNFEMNNKINNENANDNNDKKMSWTQTIINNTKQLSTTNNYHDHHLNENIDHEMKISDDSSMKNDELIDDNSASNNNNNNNNDIEDNKIEDMEVDQQSKDDQSPSHHARRPMNAFLIFCKKHRSIVRQKYPSLENRGVTRILGEWWALLDKNEKSPYTNLAKEHKDAFLMANPDFKWYKLPAPPLRSLNTRPTSLNNKVPSPRSSPTLSSLIESEFTPGKLADESQLGSLTSLMNNQNFLPSTISTTTTATEVTTKLSLEDVDDDNILSNEHNNNLEEQYHEKAYNNKLISPINLIKTSLPPKPIKKRIFSHYTDNNYKQVARNLLNDISTVTKIEGKEDENGKIFNIKKVLNRNNDNGSSNKEDNINNLTNQDLMNKIVDNMYTKVGINNKEILLKSSKEIRKSGRQCKGKRYEKFMVEGKLLGNKRDTKLTSQKLSLSKTDVNNKIENEFNLKLLNPTSTTTRTTDLMELTTPKLDLDLTIKRLAERTNVKLFNNNNNMIINDNNDNERVINNNHNNNISDNNNSDLNNKNNTNTQNTNFNLDLKINNLPSLSYEVFSERKKESKKRKCRTKFHNNNNNESINKISKLMNNNNNSNSNINNTTTINSNKIQLVGSKKRKNKQSITHLGKNKFDNNLNNDLLLDLATLAEVASNTEKINETTETVFE